MIDPITALATATAVFNGIKKAVELGREAEDVFGQLGKWASAVADLQEWMGQESKKPPLFKKLAFGRSETAEAFDQFAAKKKLEEMEKEIYHMFLYGDLNHLGLDGYRELIQMRRDIKARRERLIRDQIQRRKDLVEDIGTGLLIVLILAAGALGGWVMVQVAMDHG